MKKIVLFDIDGTLLRTGGAGIEAFDLAFRELYGRPAHWGEVSAAGRTDLSLFRELGTNLVGSDITDDELQALLDAYVKYFETTIQQAQNYTILPGVIDLLEEIKHEESLALGLGTGNLEPTAWMKVARGELDKYFSFGGFGSDSEVRSELISMGHKRGLSATDQEEAPLIIIGDTPLDIEAGKAAGALTIGVASHSFSEEELKEHEPDLVVSALTEADIITEFLLD